jgi:hypothetical protein
MPTMPPRRLLPLILLACVSCKTGRNLASKMVDTPAADQTELTAGQSRCSVAASNLHPLVVGWPSTDRVSLEARLHRGPVVVRYAGCELEVLRECALPGEYAYVGTTRKLDRVRIRSADELYANLPTNAVRLEAKLEQAGELNVSMALVGMFEARAERRDRGVLAGDCAGATHFISGVQVGAFELVAGAAAEIGAGVEAANVAGAGAKSTASREVLGQDGDADACTSSGSDDARPPANCGALVRIELLALAEPVAAKTTGIPNREQRETPEQKTLSAAREPVVETPDPDRELCDRYCRRGVECDARAQGRVVPEGKQVDKLVGACRSMCKPFVNDFSRGDLRACVEQAECSDFLECAQAGPGRSAAG